MIYILACFMAGFLGALLGGVFLGYTLDSFFAGNLEAGDAATWLAAISTLGAAIGTIGSLIMLNNQHKQTVKHQEIVWRKQEESLDFARYRDHKKEFEQLLDTLEHKHNKFYIFRDRAKLYSALFPMNSLRNDFSDYRYKLNTGDLTEWHPLRVAWQNIDKVDRILRTNGSGRFIQLQHEEQFIEYPNPLPIHQIERAIFNTTRILRLQSTRAPKTGDLVNTDDIFANVFDPMLMRDHTVDIFESINEFCGLESPRSEGVMYNQLSIGFELLRYYMRDDTPVYNKIIYGHYNIVAILLELQRVTNLLPQTHPFLKTVQDLYGFPWDRSLLNNINDKGWIRLCLETIHAQLFDITKGKMKESNEAIQQAKHAMNLINVQVKAQKPFLPDMQ